MPLDMDDKPGEYGGVYFCYATQHSCTTPHACFIGEKHWTKDLAVARKRVEEQLKRKTKALTKQLTKLGSYDPAIVEVKVDA